MAIVEVSELPDHMGRASKHPGNCERPFSTRVPVLSHPETPVEKEPSLWAFTVVL